MTELPERRRTPRVRAMYHVVVSSGGKLGEVSVAVGRTVDISESGVRVETPGVLGVDDAVRLEIALGETVVNARGRVIRVMRLGELIEAGIEFTEIAEEDRLALLRPA